MQPGAGRCSRSGPGLIGGVRLHHTYVGRRLVTHTESALLSCSGLARPLTELARPLEMRRLHWNSHGMAQGVAHGWLGACATTMSAIVLSSLRYAAILELQSMVARYVQSMVAR